MGRQDADAGERERAFLARDCTSLRLFVVCEEIRALSPGKGKSQKILKGKESSRKSRDRAITSRVKYQRIAGEYMLITI